MIKLSEYAALLHPTIKEAFDTVFDLLTNPEHNNLTWHQLLSKFESNGGKILGSGNFAVVLTHKSWKYILKIFTDDVAYLKYARFCLSNPRTSFPVFYDKPRRIIPNYTREASSPHLYVVKMEKLYPITDDEFELVLYYLYMQNDYIDSMIDRSRNNPAAYKDWTHIKEKLKSIEAQFPSIKEFKKDYHFLDKTNMSDKHFGNSDLHSGNIMRRANGELVLSDPFYRRSDVDKMNVKIGSSDSPQLKGGKTIKGAKRGFFIPS